jgi:hypothetical protein
MINCKETPRIPEFVFQRLPPFFKSLVELVPNPREKDLILLSALITTGGCFDNVTGRYGKDIIKPSLYGFAVAPAASGKSVAKYSRLLGMPLHRRMKKESPKRFLFIPGNISAASFYDRLEFNGGKGILFETEADTLSGSLTQEWGTFSDGLRKASQHETISLSRKGDDLYLEIENPCLAIFLTGTPDQVKRLIKSPEDGLASRYIFYVFEPKIEWNDPRPCDVCPDLSKEFERMGEEVLKIADWLEKNPLKFGLSSGQYDRFNVFFSNKVEESKDNEIESERSTINRMGLICFRIAMILSVFRQVAIGEKKETIVCRDEDFEISLALCDIYLEHGRVVLRGFGTSKKNTTTESKLEAFFSELPAEFTKDDAIEIGIRKVLISLRSVTNYINKLVLQGRVKKISFGTYRKVTVP